MDDPFIPSGGTYPPYFSGRKREMEIFERKLSAVGSGLTLPVAVTGERVIGKTSLLRKFESTARGNVFLAYCSVARSKSSDLLSNKDKGKYAAGWQGFIADWAYQSRFAAPCLNWHKCLHIRDVSTLETCSHNFLNDKSNPNDSKKHSG